MPLTPSERTAILALGDDLAGVWDAATTTDKDRKQLLRTLLEEVNITVHRDHDKAAQTSSCAGKAARSPSWPFPPAHARHAGFAPTKTPSTWSAVSPPTTPTRRSPASSTGSTAAQPEECHTPPVGSSRCATTGRSPAFQPGPADQEPEGELLNVTTAARDLGIAPSTLLRWLDDGFVAGEQLTPGAPWRIRLTSQLRGMLTDTAPDGWVPLGYATQALGVSRQTVLQKVKRGELNAVLTRTGRRKGLRIEIPAPENTLF